MAICSLVTTRPYKTVRFTVLKIKNMITVNNLSDNMKIVVGETTFPTKGYGNWDIYVQDDNYWGMFKANVPKDLKKQILDKLKKYS